MFAVNSQKYKPVVLAFLTIKKLQLPDGRFMELVEEVGVIFGLNEEFSNACSLY